MFFGIISVILGLILFIKGISWDPNSAPQQTVQYLAFVCSSIFLSCGFICFVLDKIKRPVIENFEQKKNKEDTEKENDNTETKVQEEQNIDENSYVVVWVAGEASGSNDVYKRKIKFFDEDGKTYDGIRQEIWKNGKISEYLYFIGDKKIINVKDNKKF